MDYWVQTNEDMNPVLVNGISDSEMQGIIKLLMSLAADGELVELADTDGNTIYGNYEQWRSVNSSKRTFTKYPRTSVRASYGTPKISLAEAKTRGDKIASDLEELFIDNDIMASLLNVKINRFASYTNAQAQIRISIEGDHRHAHAFADRLAAEMYPDISIKITDDEESETDDWYSATHIYTLRVDGERSYL